MIYLCLLHCAESEAHNINAVLEWYKTTPNYDYLRIKLIIPSVMILGLFHLWMTAKSSQSFLLTGLLA